MAVRIRIAYNKGDILCDNCGETQTHDIELYWNDTDDKIEVDKTCICHASSTKYYEEFQADAPKSN